MLKQEKIELLAPAGDLEKLKIAIIYGADAVYIGGKKFSLRARASNFDIDDIREAVSFAHKYDAKVFVTLNIIPHNENLDDLLEYVSKLVHCGIDAVICSDIHYISILKDKFPNLEIHLSTQQSTLNSLSAKFFKNLGVERIVLGRELLISDIENICNSVDMDFEVFIHGGMCMSYSGRCVLSNYMTNRDANRGGCAHSCRWNYKMFDGKRNEVGNVDVPISLASKDLVGIRHIKKLIDIGVKSLKIEGRMKSAHYIATVVNTYRKAIDFYYNHSEYNENTADKFLEKVKDAENRLVAEGFLNGEAGVNEQLYNMRSEKASQNFIGIVRDYDEENEMLVIEQRNHFKIGDIIEVFSPSEENEIFHLKQLYDEKGNLLEVARHPKQIVKIPFKFKEKYTILRKTIKKDEK